MAHTAETAEHDTETSHLADRAWLAGGFAVSYTTAILLVTGAVSIESTGGKVAAITGIVSALGVLPATSSL